MAARRLVIDTDPGLDDAVAIALLAAAPAIAIDLIVATAGNAPIDVVTANTAALAEALNLSVPLARGADGTGRCATGLWGGTGALPLPAASRSLLDASGALRSVLAGPDGMTLLAIGPLTNVAPVLAGDTARRFESIVMMGGALAGGNATPYAELNIWVDPLAAHAVMTSDIPAVIVPYDLTRTFHAPKGLADELDPSRPLAALVRAMLELLGRPDQPATLHDAAAAGWLLWPQLYETVTGRIHVTTASGPMQGNTAFAPCAQGPHRVVTAIREQHFWQSFADLLNSRH